MRLQIKDWQLYFENDRSRARRHCSFVCVPNKQHGMGFCRIMAEPDGAAIYGIWHCIVGACSQQSDRHGWLTDDGQPTGRAWGVEDLAMKFRRPESEIKRAIEVLTSEKVAWIADSDSPRTHRALTADSPSTHHEVTADSPRGHLEGREEKEEKGERAREGFSDESFAEIPSWQEFWTYCQSPQCSLTAEFYAKDKWEAANQTNWKNATNWRAYARRCKTWWESDGRPTTPNKRKQPGGDSKASADQILKKLL